ncbi:uncharacterized protein PODANS_7_10775 [Podospora anserina S mat+]|uniref:Gasdermin-like protein het-Q1 n=1 Tax=Podospora anserina (strain S / ATCC MYA-4624 / DSM 980 / FGSC 10383) TaxID=515849 RepID=HETQ1_PODAN|nr:uncharacterized protein PODANS_7_10775 [Podospora anserina S mat+]B2AXJ5.1 RecName: Full=Gasdermin-like protein het-Q1; AltName: Full=Heterokaryon incompatibility protein Q1; Contains: RecName: Full=Gasdermin-like protein het-Q1, N-terminal [Podospora anserina S mat+]CAP69119.1 unnamed protein product [Podospora anserina S mat+]CDP32598.1 Putative protein of unknown function [Podospora anserina S mat+]
MPTKTSQHAFAGSERWVVPRYSSKPGTLIRLGSVLTDPEDLESSLNLDSIPPIPPHLLRDATPEVRMSVQTELSKSDSTLAKAAPALEGILTLGGGVEASRSQGVSSSLNISGTVKATVFRADKSYMDVLLKDKNVISYAKRGLGKPMFVVVGVATAGRVEMKETRHVTRKAGVSGKVGVEVIGEGEVGLERERSDKSCNEVRGEGGLDFAYRVREFGYSRVRGTVKDKGDWTGKVLFAGGKGPVVEKGGEVVPVFKEFKEGEVKLRATGSFDVAAKA